MILVTGGAGFLGQEVVKLLINKYDLPTRCLVRPGSADKVFVDLFDGQLPEKLEIMPASFGDLEVLHKSLEGIDIVIHLAASLKGGYSAQVANTVVSSENLFTACVAQKIKRLVLCSSFGVIGASNVSMRGLIDESTPIENHPEWRDPYSFAKQMQEQLAWDFYQKRHLPLVVVRPGVIFGPPMPILSARLGLSLFGLFLHFGGNNQIPLTFKENCADMIIKAGIVAGIDGEIFCSVDDDLPTSKYLLRKYKQEVSNIRSIPVPYIILKQLSKLNVWYYNRTDGHLPAVFTPYKVDALWKGHRFSNKKAKEKLGWSPIVPMGKALDITFRTLKGMKSRPAL